MSPARVRSRWKRYLLRILLPTALAIGLFVVFIFGVIIPDFEANLLERKREMIRELTNSAVSVLQEYRNEELAGRLTSEEARKAAVERIRDLRYGPQGKDYFWITDNHPNMIMHPFRPELNNTDVSNYKDANGNRVFVEFVNRVKNDGSGYVDYVWQWKDDPTRFEAKESFVTGFPHWGWVIGTGIYTDDVKTEISGITQRLIVFSVIIILIVIFILGFVAWQSLKIEWQRQEAEAALRISHSKYKAVVETAADGTIMVSGGLCSFSNGTIQGMLGYSGDELASLPFSGLFWSAGETETAERYLSAVLAQSPSPPHIETILRRCDATPMEAILSASRVTLEGQAAAIVNVRDVSSHRRLEAELGYSRERYRLLRESIDLGVARTSVGRPVRIIEANPAGLRILGLSEAQMLSTDLISLVVDQRAQKDLLRDLSSSGVIKNRVVKFKRADGTVGSLSMSGVVITDEANTPRFCDIIFADISDDLRTEAEREALINELQTSLLFLNEPIGRYARPPFSVDMTTPARKVAERMKSGAVLVAMEGREPVGLVTDRDIRERVVAEGLPLETAAHRFMTAPIVTVSDKALVYEALQVLRDRGTEHLAVRDDSGQIVGLVGQSDLSQFHRYSSAVLIQEIRSAPNVEGLAELHSRLPVVVRTLIECGALPRSVNRVITGVSDAITERLISLVLADAGPAPARFVFMALGSEGRQEQTLVTDQDNAIVFEDVDTGLEQVQAWFQAFGERVCDGLNQIGYAHCQGQVMARNPRWNQPLSTWKAHFDGWITTRNPQDLLSVNMFFDFRGIVGDRSLVGELRKHIQGSLRRNPPFFPMMAQDVMLKRPSAGPLGFGAGGADTNSKLLNLKEVMLPFVNFARLYSLKHDVSETNTFDRLLRLYEKNILTKSSYDEIMDSYAFLMKTRLKQQASGNEDTGRGNSVNPKSLTPSEETLLKKTLGHISVLARKVSYDFLGSQQV